MAEDGIDWSFFSMARYIATADPDGSRILPRSAWDGFLDRLAEAGRLAEEAVPAAPADRASAFRGLLQLLYFGMERTLGSADPARPVLSRPWPVHLFDYGAGNPGRRVPDRVAAAMPSLTGSAGRSATPRS